MAVVTSKADLLSSELDVQKTLIRYPARYVDWGAIFAGAAVAVGVFSVFTAFGTGIGLSLISPTDGNAMPTLGLLIAAALWGLWVQLSSYMAGGYVVGRLRHRIGDAKQDEVEMRDGAHGLVMWAVGILTSGLIAAMLAMLAAGAAGSAANTAAAAVSGNGTDMQYYADRLMRPSAAASAILATPSQSASVPAAAENGNEAIAALLTRMQTNANDDDRAYLASQISQRTGVTPEDANQRLDAASAEIAEAADQARIAGVMLAFFTAVTLILSAVAAWWAAVKGGEHRDQGVDHSMLVRWR
jgi:hypothetical protein